MNEYQEQFPFEYTYDEAYNYVFKRKGVGQASFEHAKIRMYHHKYDRMKFDVRINNIQINGLLVDDYKDFLSNFMWVLNDKR